MLSRLSLNEEDFRVYSPVQYSAFFGFLVCSDPKASHLLLVFQLLLSHVGKILGFVFALRSRLDIGSMFIQESFKRFRSNENLPLDHLDVSLGYVDKISRGTTL